jgi:hypothetical protein
MLLCVSCGGDGPLRIAKPPAERLAGVEAPEIPEPTTPCPETPAELCNTDEETAGVIGAYDSALAEANRRLEWLRNFFARLPE